MLEIQGEGLSPFAEARRAQMTALLRDWIAKAPVGLGDPRLVPKVTNVVIGWPEEWGDGQALHDRHTGCVHLQPQFFECLAQFLSGEHAADDRKFVAELMDHLQRLHHELVHSMTLDDDCWERDVELFGHEVAQSVAISEAVTELGSRVNFPAWLKVIAPRDDRGRCPDWTSVTLAAGSYPLHVTALTTLLDAVPSYSPPGGPLVSHHERDHLLRDWGRYYTRRYLMTSKRVATLARRDEIAHLDRYRPIVCDLLRANRAMQMLERLSDAILGSVPDPQGAGALARYEMKLTVGAEFKKLTKMQNGFNSLPEDVSAVRLYEARVAFGNAGLMAAAQIQSHAEQLRDSFRPSRKLTTPVANSRDRVNLSIAARESNRKVQVAPEQHLGSSSGPHFDANAMRDALERRGKQRAIELG